MSADSVLATLDPETNLQVQDLLRSEDILKTIAVGLGETINGLHGRLTGDRTALLLAALRRAGLDTGAHYDISERGEIRLRADVPTPPHDAPGPAAS